MKNNFILNRVLCLRNLQDGTLYKDFVQSRGRQQWNSDVIAVPHSEAEFRCSGFVVHNLRRKNSDHHVKMGCVTGSSLNVFCQNCGIIMASTEPPLVP